MLQFAEIFRSFTGLLSFLAIAFLLGYALQQLVAKTSSGLQSGLDLFWKLISGTFLMIALYAIWSAKGMTIFLLSPVLLYCFARQKMKAAGPKEKNHLLFFCCSVILNFLFYLWAINSFNQESVTYVSGDFNIYYRIAQRLNDFGIESLNLDPVYTARHAEPYHYGDLWMYALVSRFVSTNPSVVYLVSFTLFSVIFINGIYTFAIQRFQKYISANRIFLFVLLFAGLFTGFNAFFPRFIIPSAEPYTLSVMNWSKVLVPSCLFISLLILAYNRNWWSFVLMAMIGGLSFINAMPASFMTVFLILTLNAVRKGISWKQWFVYHLCYVGITVAFVVLLYKVLPALSGTAVPKADSASAHIIDIKQYLLTAVKIFIGGWFQLFVLTPFFIIFFTGLALSGRLKQVRSLITGLDNDILFLVFMIFSGLSCWAILHPFAVDAVQFYTNVLAPVYAISISFLVLYVLYVFKHKILSAVTLVCLAACLFIHRSDVFFTNQHDRAEWNQLTTYLGRHSSGHSFASIRPLGHFNSFFDKNTIYFMPLSFLNYYWPDYHNFSLNAPFIPVNESSLYANEERTEINLAPFTQYYREKLKDGTSDAVAIMHRFIEEQKIGYLSVSRDTSLPAHFRPLVLDSITLEKANFVVYRIR